MDESTSTRPSLRKVQVEVTIVDRELTVFQPLGKPFKPSAVARGSLRLMWAVMQVAHDLTESSSWAHLWVEIDAEGITTAVDRERHPVAVPPYPMVGSIPVGLLLPEAFVYVGEQAPSFGNLAGACE